MYGYTSQLRLSALADTHCDHRVKDKDFGAQATWLIQICLLMLSCYFTHFLPPVSVVEKAWLKEPPVRASGLQVLL